MHLHLPLPEHRERTTSSRLLPGMVILFFSSIIALATQAQTIADADFENGGAGWNTCSVEVLPLSVLGGGSADHVAVVDGDGTNGHQLCQRIAGFTVGAQYRLRFLAGRWMPSAIPAMVSAGVYLNGALFVNVTRTGDLDLMTEDLPFTAESSTIDLRIASAYTAGGAMIIDDFSLVAENMLTIQLTDYSAWQENDAVEVAWTTVTENGNDHFEVERSADLLEWTAVGTVPAVGHSQTPLPYHLLDPAPLEGAAYYHLKQVGQDGNVDVSPAMAVYFEGGDERPLLWPNPATDHLRLLTGGSDRKRLRVIDLSGRVMPVSEMQDGGEQVLGIAALPSGQYQVQDADTNAPLGRFIKL